MGPTRDRIPARARQASRTLAWPMRPQTRQRHHRSRHSSRIFCLLISNPSRRPRHLSSPSRLSSTKTTGAHRRRCFACCPPASWRAYPALAPEEAALNREVARRATAAKSRKMENLLAAAGAEFAALAWVMTATSTGLVVVPRRTEAAWRAQLAPSRRLSTASNSCI